MLLVYIIVLNKCIQNDVFSNSYHLRYESKSYMNYRWLLSKYSKLSSFIVADREDRIK